MDNEKGNDIEKGNDSERANDIEEESDSEEETMLRRRAADEGYQRRRAQ
jgi:hypothetical protein